jgi:hypothetical protein
VDSVIIGMDPHKRSATIEIIDERENVLAQGRFGTDSDGYRTMLALGRRFGQRIWAVEGCNGIGRHIAQRLVADGETVVDVPALAEAITVLATRGQIELFYGEPGGELGLVSAADVLNIVADPTNWWSPVERTTPETALVLTT